MSALLLRRANVSRPSGQSQHEDYDVFDGARAVGRIYRWSTRLSLDEAKAAFRAEHDNCIAGCR